MTKMKKNEKKELLHACLLHDDRDFPASGRRIVSSSSRRKSSRRKKKKNVTHVLDGNTAEFYLKLRPHRSALYFLQQRASALQALSVRDLFPGCEVRFPRRLPTLLRSYIIPANGGTC